MTGKKIVDDFNGSMEEIKKLVRFKEERKRITLLPNCYKILIEQEVASDTAIGYVEKIYAVTNANGEVITETTTQFVQKAVSVADMNCGRGFLNLMEDVFECDISIDKSLRFIDNEGGIELKGGSYVFVPFEQLFLDRDIFPFRVDEENKDIQKIQLFYYAFPKGLQEYRSCPRYNTRLDKVQQAYDKILKKADRDDIYVPFYVRADRELAPMLYPPRRGGLLRPLPALYGAAFDDQSTYDRYAGIRCKANDGLDDFCFYWRSIKQEPGASILYEWNDLEEILEYSKFKKEGT